MTVSPSFYIYSATIETNISLVRILLLISPYFCTNIRLLESRLSLSCSFHIYLKAGVVTRQPQLPQILLYFPPYLYAHFTSLDPRLSLSFFHFHIYIKLLFFFCIMARFFSAIRSANSLLIPLYFEHKHPIISPRLYGNDCCIYYFYIENFSSSSSFVLFPIKKKYSHL
jgi:hypothetical protein